VTSTRCVPLEEALHGRSTSSTLQRTATPRTNSDQAQHSAAPPDRDPLAHRSTRSFALAPKRPARFEVRLTTRIPSEPTLNQSRRLVLVPFTHKPFSKVDHIQIDGDIRDSDRDPFPISRRIKPRQSDGPQQPHERVKSVAAGSGNGEVDLRLVPVSGKHSKWMPAQPVVVHPGIAGPVRVGATPPPQRDVAHVEDHAELNEVTRAVPLRALQVDLFAADTGTPLQLRQRPSPDKPVVAQPRRQPPASRTDHRCGLIKRHQLSQRARVVRPTAHLPRTHDPILAPCSSLPAGCHPTSDRYQIFAITCPFRRPTTWASMRRDRPALFARACELEDLLNVRRVGLGKDPVWLTRFNRPLRDAIGAAQVMLPGFDTGHDDAQCDNGACFT
jgi:hypothetical protein